MNNKLLHLALEGVADALKAGAADDEWRKAERAMQLAADDDPEIDESDAALAVELRDADELGKLVTGWRDGSLPLPPADKAILKRAMKALRKRIKLERLDEESSLGGSALTGGRESGICAVRPPEQYPVEVWATLQRLGRVLDAGHGLLEPVGES